MAKPKVSLCKKILKKWDYVKELEKRLTEANYRVALQSNTGSEFFRGLQLQAGVISKEFERAKSEYESIMEEFREVVNKKEQKNESR